MPDVSNYFESVNEGPSNKVGKAANEQVSLLFAENSDSKEAMENEQYNIGAVALVSSVTMDDGRTLHRHVLDVILAQK